MNLDINQITKQMMEIEELITQNKLDQGPNSYNKSDFQNYTAQYASLQSSLMSERTSKVKSHYDSQRLNGTGNPRKKSRRDDDSLSISNPCDVKCNIF